MSLIPNELKTKLAQVEAGYVNNKNDSGGETNRGITIAVARAHGYTGPMKDLPESVAWQIYSVDYWTDPHYDVVYAIAPRIAGELLDTGVNAGVARSTMILQRSLKVLQDVTLNVDGKMNVGGSTLTCLSAYLKRRASQHGELELLKLMNCLQGELYTELVEKNVKNQDFIFGWVTNRIEVPNV